MAFISSGSGPVRSFRLSAVISAMSSADSSKSNSAKFSSTRLRVTDFGKMTSPDVVLDQVGVHLDLVDGRHDLAVGQQPAQVVRLEVGDADRPGPAGAVDLLQRVPGLHVVADLR